MKRYISVLIILYAELKLVAICISWSLYACKMYVYAFLKFFSILFILLDIEKYFLYCKDSFVTFMKFLFWFLLILNDFFPIVLKFLLKSTVGDNYIIIYHNSYYSHDKKWVCTLSDSVLYLFLTRAFYVYGYTWTVMHVSFILYKKGAFDFIAFF